MSVKSRASDQIKEGSDEDFSSTDRRGTFGKNRRVIADWNRAKEYVDNHLEKKTEKFREAYERKKLRQKTMKNLNLQQPSESIGEDQDSEELDLEGEDDLGLGIFED